MTDASCCHYCYRNTGQYAASDPLVRAETESSEIRGDRLVLQMLCEVLSQVWSVLRQITKRRIPKARNFRRHPFFFKKKRSNELNILYVKALSL